MISPGRRLLVSLVVMATSLAHGAEPLPGSSLESLLQAAREGSPDLRMARLEAEAASERIGPAGALPDPTLRMELENITKNGSQNANFSPNRVGDTKYTLLQPLPFWGKRDLKQAVAAAEADAARGKAGDTWSELASRIKTLYAQYWQACQSARLTRQIIDLSVRLEQVAQIRYAGGLAAQQDAIRAQVERTNLESELLALDSERHHLMVFLNTMLARPANSPLAEPERLRPLPAPAKLETAPLAQRLQANNSQVTIEAARLDMAEKTRDLTYRNRYPDLTVGIVPMQVQNRVESWSVMLEMNIPLQQGSRRSQEREAERLLEAAQARKEALGHRLLGEVSAALSNLETARETERLTANRLLPQAELTFKAALSAYENGKVDFTTLLDAQRQIRNAKLNLIRAQATQQVRLAEIERLIGEDL